MPPKERAKAKKESIRLLRGLCRRLRGKPHNVSSNVRNEFYFQTKQYRKQYQLGVMDVRKGVNLGYYSQGVGAAWHAWTLLERNHRKRAIAWARKSERAWKFDLKLNSKYYNSYIHYALAVGIQGRFDESEELLRVAQRLSGKKKDHHEFQRIRSLLRRIQK